MSILEDNKYPTSRQNHISVEIECLSSSWDSVEKLEAKLLAGDLGYNCTVKDDGSIDREGDDGETLELVICAPQTEVKSIVEKVCKILKEAGFRVNKTCGLHVHIDMRNRKVNIAFNRLVKKQDLIFSIVDPARITNTYSMPVSSIKDKFGRKAINYGAYRKHKTLEIRAHEGTINPFEINNYIDMLVKIADGKPLTKINNKYIAMRQSYFKLKEKVA